MKRQLAGSRHPYLGVWRHRLELFWSVLPAWPGGLFYRIVKSGRNGARSTLDADQTPVSTWQPTCVWGGKQLSYFIDQEPPEKQHTTQRPKGPEPTGINPSILLASASSCCKV
jgi:hypothetical protein